MSVRPDRWSTKLASRAAAGLRAALDRLRAREGPGYDLVFRENPVPMWVFDVETLAFLAVNRAACERYGWSREEFLAMTIEDIRPEEDVAALREWLERRKGQPARPGMFRHRLRSGEVLHVEVVSRDVRFAGRRARIVLATDVTQQIAAAQALRKSEEQYRLVTDSLPLRIAYLGLDERYRFVNLPYERSFGRPRAGIIGLTVRELIGEAAYATAAPQLARAKRGEHVTYAQWRETERGPRHDAVTYVPRRDESGAVVGLFSIVADDTETYALEQELLHAQRMEAIGQLAGGVAHDFNNLLTVITSVTALLLESERLGEAEREDLAEIERATSRATDLTRKLLAFGRKQPMQPRVVHLDALVSDAEKMLRRLVREDLDLRIALGPTTARVHVDPTQVDQVLMNLVVNAQDATPAGGTVTLETAEVEVDAALAQANPGVAPGAYVLLAVSDTGVGMTPEVRARAFEPFFTTKEKGRGTGLGLASVYGIVRQSGGFVHLASEPGHGTTVSVYLPRVAAPADGEQAAPERPPVRTGTETILLVEDDEVVRRIARRILQARGYDVRCAKDGVDALSLVARFEGRLDLLVTDVIMPALGGRELARRLTAARPGLPVLFLSGYTADELGANAVLPPGTLFLPKPFTPEALARAVRDALDRVAAGRPPAS